MLVDKLDENRLNTIENKVLTYLEKEHTWLYKNCFEY